MMTVPVFRYATPRTPDRPSRGRKTALTSAMLGAPFMPWQAHVSDVAGELDADGRPAYGTIVVTVPRQSGKTTLVRATSVSRCLQYPGNRSWYTAQTRNSARDRFMDAIGLLRRGPLAPHTSVRLTNGSESVSWPNGAQWRLFAPQPDALHGETIDDATFDEAWAHDVARGNELLQAAIPAGSTRPRFQLWIISTAGDTSSQWLRDFVDAGRAAVDADARNGLAYFECSAPSGALADVIAAHPAVGHTITADAVRQAHDVLPAGEFARAYGNLWTASGERALPELAWTAVQAPGPPPTGPPATLALDVSPDRSAAAIAVAWATDTTPHVAVAAAGPGVDWIGDQVERLARRFAAPILYDETSPAAAVVDLLPTDVARRSLGTRDVVVAAQQMFDAVMGARVAVRPDAALDAAAAAAVTRPVGDAWTWGRRRSGGDITSLIAATFALWGHAHPPPEPVLLV